MCVGKKITPGLDPCKDKKRWKRYDPDRKWTKGDTNLGGPEVLSERKLQK